MRYVYCVILLAALAFAGSAVAAAQTADELVEKHLTAIGGRDAMSKLHSRIETGTMTVTTPGGDVAGTVEVYNKAPNKSRRYVRMDLSQFGMGEFVMDQRFDGSTGYVIDTMNGNRELSGSALESAKNDHFPSALLKYKNLEIKIELTGTDKVGNRDAQVLVLTPKTGSTAKLFLDSETYLALKMVQTVNVPQLGGDIEQTVEFSDYREVDGMKLPFEMKVSNPAQSITMKITKIEHNKDIDDTMFARPAEK